MVSELLDRTTTPEVALLCAANNLMKAPSEVKRRGKPRWPRKAPRRRILGQSQAGRGRENKILPFTPKKKKDPPGIRPPKSSVVVLTLLHGTAEMWVTFVEMLTKSKHQIKFEDIGLKTGVQPKGTHWRPHADHPRSK